MPTLATNLGVVPNVSENASILIDTAHSETRMASIIFFVVSITLASFVIISNSLFIIACWKHTSLRTIATMHVNSLAVADMILSVALCMQGAYYVNNTTRIVHSVKYLCLSTVSIVSTGLTSSLLAVMLIALDRYVYIVHPYRYSRLINARRTKYALCVTWTLSALYGTMPLYYNKFREEEGCSHTSTFPQYAMSRLVLFLSASIATGFCHASIQYTALVQIRRIYPRRIYPPRALPLNCRRWITRSSSEYSGQTSTSSGSGAPVVTPASHVAATMRLIKSFFLVYVFFFFSWFPGIVVFTLGSTSRSLLNAVAILAELSTALNVCVYVFSNKQFKEAILSILNCKKESQMNI